MNVCPQWKEFFQVKGEFSMRNLTVFITIVAGTAVVLYMALMDTLTAEIFIAYLLAGGGVYSFGKWQDDKTSRAEIDATAPPDPAPITNNTVNQPEVVNVAPKS